MSFIVLPRKRRRPDQFTLDYGHPLAQGLVFAGLQDQGTVRVGGKYINSVCGGAHGVGVGSGSKTSNSIVMPEIGRVGHRLIAANTSAISLGDNLVSTGPFTLSLWVQQMNSGISWCSRSSSAATGVDFLSNAAWSGSALWRAPNQDFSGYCATVDPSILNHFLFTIEWAVGGFWEGKQYVNGKFHRSGNYNSVFPATQAHSIGVRGGVSYSTTDFADPMIHNRVLSPAEIALLADRTDPMLGGLIKEKRTAPIYSLPSVNHWELYVKLGVDGTWVDAGNFAPDVDAYLKTTGLESGTYYAKLRKYTNGVPSEWEYSDAITYTASGGTTNDLAGQNIVTGDPAVTSPALGQTHALAVQNVAADAPVITSAAIGQAHALTAQSIAADSPTVTTPSLTSQANTDALTGQDIVVGSPAITTATLGKLHVLNGDGVALGAPVITSSALGQAHALFMQSVALGAPVITTPSLSVSVNADHLTGQDVETGQPAVGSPAIAQIHVLGGDGVALGAPVITAPALGQTHELTSQNVTGGAPEVSMPSMTPSISLTGQSIETAALAISTPAIGQVHALTSETVLVGNLDITAPALGQLHILLGQDVVLGAPFITSAVMYNADFLPNARISLATQVALGFSMKSSVCLGITRKSTTGMNLDME